MIFDECHFEYGGYNSRENDLIFAHLDTSQDNRMSGESAGRYIFNSKGMRRYMTGVDYSDSAFSTEVEIVSSCATPIPIEEIREIQKKLFYRRGYRKLYLDQNDAPGTVSSDGHRLYLNCVLMNPSKIEDGGGNVVGFKCTLEADSMMFWRDPVTKSASISGSGSKNVTVSVDTDLDDYIYPKVTIQVGSTGGDITISNNNDDSTRLTKFVGLSPLSKIIMKGDINYVSGQNYQRFVERNFIRMLDGNNTFTITGDVSSIEFEYSERRAL